MSANTWDTQVQSKDTRVDDVIRALSVQPILRTAELAIVVGLGSSHLRHLFRRHLGFSIDAYRMEARLLRACDLLTGTVLSVKQIRYEIGIPDASNFVHHFRRRFGVTPSSFRRTVEKSRSYQLNAVAISLGHRVYNRQMFGDTRRQRFTM
jgi:transcriptional regulator GlxA family with amidase domain